MYISELEIFGFKSFALKTKLKFSQGITCVVGPNGCGKTNVVDALRWVMGEQKSSTLRSDKMTDVIFAGSKYKKPLNYAEVALTIHNNRQLLSVAYENVLISRRLFRDGTSEYLLNNTPVRLKDIQDLFVDTGMSTDAYSVIELKMVEEILNENKEARKHLFEEAAGINKYKNQRKSAHRKLDATREDLTRLEDIIYEIDKKVSALKRQLNKYEKYREYTDELRDLEIVFAQWQWQDIQDLIIPLEEQLGRNQVRQTETGQQLGIEEAMLGRYKNDLEKMESDLEAVNETLGRLNHSLNENHSQIILWQEKIQNANHSINRLTAEKEQAQQRRLANEKIREDISADLNANDPAISRLRERQEELQQKLKAAEAKYADIHQTMEHLRNDLIGLQQKVREKEQLILRLEDQKKQKQQLFEENENRLMNARLRLEAHQSALNAASDELANLHEQLSRAEKAEATYKAATESQRNSLDNLKAQRIQLRGRIEQTRNELEFFQSIVESMEGFNPGVKYTMKELKHPGIRGTVADLVTVDEKYTQAIEIGLGNAARFLVSDTKDAALDVIEDLKAKRRGRVTIIPLDIIRDRYREPRPFTDIDKNVIGPATDFIHTAPELRILVDYFLGDLMLVHSLRDIADKVLRESRYRFVTPDGDYIEQKGLIKGGRNQRDNQQQILGRKEKIAALESELKEYSAALNSIDQQLMETESALAEAIRQSEEYDRSLRTVRRDIQEQEKRRDTLEYARQHTDDSILEAQNHIAEYQSAIHDLDEQIGRTSVERDETEQAAERLRHKVARFQSDHQQIITVRDDLNRGLQDIRVELISQEREKETIQYRYQNALDTINELTQRLTSIDKEINNQQTILREGESALTQLRLDRDQESLAFDEQTEIRKNQSASIQSKKEQIRDLELSITQQHRQRENVFQTLRDIEIRLSDIRMKQMQIKERMFDRYHIDITLRHFELPDMNRDELEQTLDKLHRRIELIGPINMAVKTEYDEENARLTFLQEQQNDLLEAEKSLIETIDKLDIEARKQFETVFAQIRENFHKTFTLFFPNGSGDIRLVGNSDPLEADVEIFARPKAKEMKSLKALSGGEKALTAIALLFSIYLVKPSPYCILDEVDAPLDDQNIQRFTSALKHFTNTTQFIIVTHNKLTMKAANYLYGVTMEEEGVSKIVSVQFHD